MLPEFLLTAILVELTPGPKSAWLGVLSAWRRRAAGLAAVARVAIGFAIAGAAAVLGPSTLIGKRPLVFRLLRWAGSIYLLYLAWGTWQQADDFHDGTFDLPIQHYFAQGLMGNILNPKAYLFYAGVLPHFVDKAYGLLPLLALLTGVYVGVATTIHAAIALLAGSLSDFFAAPAKYLMMGKVFAGLLFAVAIWLFNVTGAKP
jgi:threonine/homoserine/homoserine lactone efflux protein